MLFSARIVLSFCDTSFSMLRYQNLWKFGGNTTIQTWILVNNVWKYPKNVKRIKGCSITCIHIWHIDMSKCVYRLDTHFVKVLWSYMLSNTNAIHFCDIFLDSCLYNIYGPFGSRTFLSVSRKNGGNIGLLKIGKNYEKNNQNFVY